MAYTHAWDVTQPPDSQLANQLGQDIRDLKTDVAERLSLSGTLANRPTPEAIFAGVLYFATDLNLLYRWSGSAWSVVGVHPKFVDAVQHNISNGTFTGSVINIPAGVLKTGSVIDTHLRAAFTVGGSASTIRLFVGGQAIGVWPWSSGVFTSFARLYCQTLTSVAGGGVAIIGTGTSPQLRNAVTVADVNVNGIQIACQVTAPGGVTIQNDYMDALVFP